MAAATVPAIIAVDVDEDPVDPVEEGPGVSVAGEAGIELGGGDNEFHGAGVIDEGAIVGRPVVGEGVGDGVGAVVGGSDGAGVSDVGSSMRTAAKSEEPALFSLQFP